MRTLPPCIPPPPSSAACSTYRICIGTFRPANSPVFSDFLNRSVGVAFGTSSLLGTPYISRPDIAPSPATRPPQPNFPTLPNAPPGLRGTGLYGCRSGSAPRLGRSRRGWRRRCPPRRSACRPGSSSRAALGDFLALEHKALSVFDVAKAAVFGFAACFDQMAVDVVAEMEVATLPALAARRSAAKLTNGGTYSRVSHPASAPYSRGAVEPFAHSLQQTTMQMQELA